MIEVFKVYRKQLFTVVVDVAQDALVYMLLLVLMYMPIVTRSPSSPAVLLAYWILVAVAGLGYTWLRSRGWGSSG